VNFCVQRRARRSGLDDSGFSCTKNTTVTMVTVSDPKNKDHTTKRPVKPNSGSTRFPAYLRLFECVCVTVCMCVCVLRLSACLIPNCLSSPKHPIMSRLHHCWLVTTENEPHGPEMSRSIQLYVFIHPLDFVNTHTHKLGREKEKKKEL